AGVNGALGAAAVSLAAWGAPTAPAPEAPAAAPQGTPSAPVTAPQTAPALTPLDLYKRDVAREILKANAPRTFDGVPPHFLRAVVVLQVTVDGKGAVTDIRTVRTRDAGLAAVATKTVRPPPPLPAPPPHLPPPARRPGGRGDETRPRRRAGARPAAGAAAPRTRRARRDVALPRRRQVPGALARRGAGASVSRLRLLADDLTGALDTAAQFAGACGPVTVRFRGDDWHAPLACLAYATATREAEQSRVADELSR